MKRIIRVTVKYSGKVWHFIPEDNQLNDYKFMASDEEMIRFLRRIKAKDEQTDPKSMRGLTYKNIIDEIKSGRDNQIFVFRKYYPSSEETVRSLLMEKVKVMKTENRIQLQVGQKILDESGQAYEVEEGDYLIPTTASIKEEKSQTILNLEQDILDLEQELKDLKDSDADKEEIDSVKDELKDTKEDLAYEKEAEADSEV